MGIPKLIYNSDGDSTTLGPFEPPITVDQACRDIEEVVGTAVDVFSNSMGRGDETFSHPTEYGSRFGDGVTEWPEAGSVRWVKRMYDNERALTNQGVNLVELLAERAHARGLQFWPTLRMNDIHEDDSTRFSSFRSEFKKANPELLIGSPYPQRYGYGYPADDFTWAFDFIHEEVRERKIGLILETCERYDVDGFELDFQRGPWYFKDGMEQEGMPLLTDMMRKIREGTKRIAAGKGRPFTLMLRIAPTLAKCEANGIDAPTWIQEELADLFVPMNNTYLDMSAHVKQFVELAKGTSCHIGAGLEHLAKGYGHAGADMLYAAASSYFRQGATFIYLFNYDCHRKNLPVDGPYTPAEIQVLREIHDPALISRRNKCYTVTADVMSRLPEEGGLFPLPFLLHGAGDAARFTIHVGDDIEAARRDGVLNDMWLRVTATDGRGEHVDLSVALNGETLGPGHRAEMPKVTTLTHDGVPARQDDNEVAITLSRTDQAGPVRLEGIELVITYRGAS
ncbi:MAG: hypothetical protein CMJ18_00080 [Phycisphaeraceae bacterium]|nr:hypothetical protein [Phycisphaeraceae bacterium]